jgi:hypothetical protein
MKILLSIIVFLSCSYLYSQDNFQKGYDLINAKEYEKSIIHFLISSDIDSTKNDSYYFLGLAYFGLKKIDISEYYFNKGFLQLSDPNYEDKEKSIMFLRFISLCAYLQNDYSRACSLYTALVLAGDKTPETFDYFCKTCGCK